MYRDEKTITSVVNRRAFFTGAGTAVTAFSLMKPELVFGAVANSKVKLGLCGCGGRGTWISKLFQQHGGYELVAVADYFKDRVDQYGDLFSIPEANRFTGLAGYKRMLEKKLVDAIAVESPPYFHPEQAAAGVEAGAHVYVAKPIAVDVPGCLTIENSGKKARAGKLCFLIDFQTRANNLYKEAIQRAHNGDIGLFAFGESSYHAGNPWERQVTIMKSDPKKAENRLRAWGLDRILSGDIITEQNIHTLDVASWIINEAPIQAWGLCGQKVRNDGGDVHDSFQVTFEYPNSIGIAFSSRQFDGYETSEGIKNRMFGADGVLETEYGGNVILRGKKAFPGGNTGNIFTDGVVTNIATFHKSIMDGNYENPTVECSVRSNLTTILGRTAAYKKEVVTWDSLLKNAEKLDFDFTGMKE